jgi:hypothetical protein
MAQVQMYLENKLLKKKSELTGAAQIEHAEES